jgi:hypothetical protein
VLGPQAETNPSFLSANAEDCSQMKTQCLLMPTQITAFSVEAEVLQVSIDNKLLRYTVDPRTSNGLMFEQLETRTKFRRKSCFESRTQTRNSNKESRGRHAL